MEKEEKPAEDALLAVIGQKGRWQFGNFFFLTLVWIPSAWNMLAITFLAPTDVDYWCAPPPSLSHWSPEQWKQYAIPTEVKDGQVVHQRCKMYNISYTATAEQNPGGTEDNTTDLIDCRTWHYDNNTLVTHQFNLSVFGNSARNAFDLACDTEEMVAHAQSTYMVGVLVGAVMGGICADIFGRRPVMLVCLAAFLVFGVASAFAQSIAAFMGLRFFISCSMRSLATVAYVYILEPVGGQWRAILGVSQGYGWTTGVMSLAGIAYILNDFRYIQLCIVLPAVVFSLIYFLTPESPRWLLSRGREEEARKIIEKVCKVNDRPYHPSMPLLDINDASETRGSFWDLFRTPNLRCRTLNFYYIWFVNSFVYYGLSLNSGDLGGDVFLNMLLGGIVEIPSHIVCTIVLLKYGRKWPLCLSMVVGGVALLFIMIFTKGAYVYDWPIVTLAMVGKFCIASSFSIIYVYSAEVFPTVLRISGLGSSSMFSRFGSILAPYVGVYGGRVYKHLPVILFGATSILAGLLSLLLPETMGRALPDTVEQGEAFGTDRESSVMKSSGGEKKVSTGAKTNPAFISEQIDDTRL